MFSVQDISDQLATKLSKKISLDKFKEVWGIVIKIFPSLADKLNLEQIKSINDLLGLYSYGITVFVGLLFKGPLLIIISIIFGIFTPIMFVVTTFSSFRVVAGGYHMQTYLRCWIVSFVTFIGSALIVQHTLQYWSTQNISSLFIFCILMGLYIIFRYIPRDTPNKPITEPLEIAKFKKWSLYYLISWVTIMTIFLFFNLKLIVISSCFGLLLELFSISKIGYSLYSLVDDIGIHK